MEGVRGELAALRRLVSYCEEEVRGWEEELSLTTEPKERAWCRGEISAHRAVLLKARAEIDSLTESDEADE